MRMSTLKQFPPRDKFAEGLMAAAALGMMPRSVVAAVTEVFTPDRLSLDDLRFLKGPFVVSNAGGWDADIPQWLFEAAGAERIGIVFGVTPQYIVGPAEIAAVMFAATMVAPMGHYHSDLYIWATINAHAKRNDLDPAKLFRELLDMDPIEDRVVLLPGGRLYETYRHLAHDIRAKVVARQAEHDRAAKREGREEQVEHKAGHGARPRPVEGVDMTQSLFDSKGAW
jgi:hypothetical protein